MKILVYDVDVMSSGTKYPLQAALEDLGHEAVMFDWQKELYSYSNNSLLNRVKDRMFKLNVENRINRHLRQTLDCGPYDLMIVVNGNHIFPETLEYAKRHVSVVVNWNSDDLFNDLNNSTHILRSIDKYDIHFSPRGHLKEEHLRHGAKAFESLDWYYRYGLLFPRPEHSISKYENDISFVGSWSKHREEILSCLSAERLSIYGWGWKKYLKSRPQPWQVNQSLKISEMMNVMAKSKININILTVENRDTSNLRNYEIPASGGFQLSERSEYILELFKEDVEIVCFSSKEELLSKTKFYLENDSLREKIALAGYDKISKGRYSLRDRLKFLINRTEQLVR